MTFMNVDKRGRGTLPEEVRRVLGLEDSDTNLLLLEKTPHGTYEIVPATLVPKDQLWFRHPEMQQRLERAEVDFHAGRSTRADTLDETQALLDSFKR
ncbi:MAG: AbrB/MazE/SpoVT family DNA-binding domain-containing protein [Gemmatimonadota bacterium]|nr:AbrB/MazE/SpoVT family DNA-binding domain-containing protein [Gemmatimonadota bacterium]